MFILYMLVIYFFSSSFDGIVLVVMLMRVIEVIFDDVFYYYGCIEDVNLFFVVDLKIVNVVCKENVNYKDLIMFFFIGVWL